MLKLLLIRVRALLAIFLFLSVKVIFAQSGEGVLLTNAHLIVGDGQQFNAVDVLVQDGQIAAVAENIQIDSAEIREIDLSGKTLLPMLIDGHSHLGYQSSEGWGAEFYSRENLIRNLQQYLYFGFSAVFSAGSDPDDLALALQAEQNAGEFAGAKLLFAAGMAPPGEGPNNQFLVHTSSLEQELDMIILRGLETPAQAREQVRQVSEKGIRFLKLWVDDRGGTQTKLSQELYKAVADEAQNLGLKVLIHQQFASDMPDLLDAGVHGFLHGRIGDDFSTAIAEQLAASNVFVVPNLGLGELRREAIGDDSFLRPFLNNSALERLSVSTSQRQLDVTLDPAYERVLSAGFERLRAAGADLVLGTDAGAVPDHPFGYTGHRELEIFVRLGVSEMDALVAGTGNAAKHLGLEDLGMVVPGYRADLLILNANPLTDIRNTRNIDSIFVGGKELDRAILLQEIMQ